MKSFYKGSAVHFAVTIYDVNSALTNPQSLSGVLYDAASSIVGTGALTKSSTGNFYIVMQSSPSISLGVAELELTAYNGQNTYVNRATQVKFI
jgi:hypothetical protein